MLSQKNNYGSDHLILKGERINSLQKYQANQKNGMQAKPVEKNKIEQAHSKDKKTLIFQKI